jgi:hypothetical protein
VWSDGGFHGRREGSNPMKYAIAIPAIVACAFYVYVLIQLRRDEKRHSLPSAPSERSIAGPLEFKSFMAVRKPGQSFAEWSRLAKRRNPGVRDANPASKPKQYKAAAKLHRISYVEMSLPLSSGVAPAIEDSDISHREVFPKKIA